MIVVIIIVVLVLLAGLTYVLLRNSLISLNQRVGESWSGIDVQLKRRHDLVPNLVETVKGYATHESQTFEKVTQARAAAMAASGPAEAGQAEGQLTAALGGLRVVAEQYPELRATENFQQLQRQLSELEDEIQASRRIYNSNVQQFNTRIQQFPSSIAANQLSYTPKEYFSIDEPSEREAPQVSFNSPEQPAAAAEASAPEQPPAG
jgi:LemA protein